MTRDLSEPFIFDTGTIDVLTRNDDADSRFHINFQSMYLEDKSGRGNDSENAPTYTILSDFTRLDENTDESLLFHRDPNTGELVKMQKGTDFSNDYEVAMGRKYTLSNNSPLPLNGTLKIEVIPIMKTGYASTSSDQPERYLSSQGDLKYSIIFEWPKGGTNDSDTFVYLEIEYKSKNGIRKVDHLRNIYHIDGMDTALYIPNQYYSLNRESGAMELQTMEIGYPKLSPVKEVGTQTLTLQFRKNTKIYYDSTFELLPQYAKIVKGCITFEEVEAGSQGPVKNILEWIHDLVGTDVQNELFPFVIGDIEDINVQEQYSLMLWGGKSFSKQILDVEGKLKGSLLIFSSKEEKIESSKWFPWFGKDNERIRMEYSLYFGQPKNDAAKKELLDIMNWGTRFTESFFEYHSSNFDGNEKTKASIETFERLKNEEGNYSKKLCG